MSSIRVPVAIIFCLFIEWTWALPKRTVLNGESSGAGEIPDGLRPDFRPFDEPLGKGYPDNEVFDNYDLDSEGGPKNFPEYDTNDIRPLGRPEGDGAERPDDRIPEEKHPEDEPKEEPEEEEDHEPPLSEKPMGREDTHDEEEEEPETDEGEGEPHLPEEDEPETKEGEGEPHLPEEDEPETKEGEGEPHLPEKDEPETKEGEGEMHVPEGEDSHAVEDGEKLPGGKDEETQEGGGESPHPFNSALFSFHQVNHYIKQLEKAMEHVFKETLEDASLLNNTFANTTEEEVEMGGHKYKVQKSLIKTGDEDTNSTLLIEAISSVSEDESKKNRSERSNPDSEPIQ